MTTFKSLGLSDEVLKALSDLGFEKPSEIQEQAIPYLVGGEGDFIGLAQTGTGKTAAFGIPLIENIDPTQDHTQALVLAPTRELGKQIAEQLFLYSKHTDKFNVLAVYGGAAISNQIKDLRRPQHIIIATPGRLIDLINRGAVKLDKLDYLVLDEADEMLNMGFKEDIDKILSHTPESRDVWLFSATMAKDIRRIVKQYMSDPKEVRINPSNEVNTNISHQYIVTKSSEKAQVLCRLMDAQPDMRGVIFCRTRRNTKDLADTLVAQGYKADAIHGDLSQQQRDRVMRRFKSSELQMLVATDVAARGIDVNDLSHVIHFNLPDEQAYYTHRSGRTARAGKKGTSIAFINGREQRVLRTLERSLGISFTEAEVPSATEVTDFRIMAWCQKVVDVETDYKLDEDLFEKTMLMFDGISKEELIAKFLIQEVDKLNLAAKRQLTYNPGESPRGGGGGGGRSKDRKRGGGGRDRRGGGGGGRFSDRRSSSRSSDRGGRSDRGSSRSSERSSDRRSSERRPSDRRITDGGSNAEFRISKGGGKSSSDDSSKKHRKGEKAWRNPGKSKDSKGKGKKK